VPEVPTGPQRVQSNDATVDDRGAVYLYNGFRGLHILERISRLGT
jgi:hypothetical protein